MFQQKFDDSDVPSFRRQHHRRQSLLVLSVDRFGSCDEQARNLQVSVYRGSMQSGVSEIVPKFASRPGLEQYFDDAQMARNCCQHQWCVDRRGILTPLVG